MTELIEILLALVLKIVINSVYGKLGFENGNLYDRLAVLKTTINGQLMMLMLVEELELHNIHVLSANTDGIVIKLINEILMFIIVLKMSGNKLLNLSLILIIIIVLLVEI